MTDVPEGSSSAPGDPNHEIFDMQAFRDNGLLWALNRYVLHPRGLAMWLHYVPVGGRIEDQEVNGWGILPADDGIWSFSTDTDLAGRTKFDAFLDYIKDRSDA